MIESNLMGLMSCWMAFTVAAFVPGPNNVAVISVALGAGRRSGLFVAMGIALGAFFWALITAYGLASLFTVYPHLIKVFALAGGSYLCWLGLKAIVKLMFKPIIAAEFYKANVKHAVLHGFMVTATNPKAALFWLSLSTLVSSVSVSLPVMIIFALVVSILAFGVYGGYAVAFSLKNFRNWYTAKQHYFLLIFGSYFLVAGLFLILRLGLN